MNLQGRYRAASAAINESHPRMKQLQTLIKNQVFRGGTLGEMDPGIKKESEERVTCADGSFSLSAAPEDLGSKSNQPSDQQSETLNLTKVFKFTFYTSIRSNFHSSIVQRLISKDDRSVSANERGGERRNASDPESSPISPLKSRHQVNLILSIKPCHPQNPDTAQTLPLEVPGETL